MPNNKIWMVVSKDKYELPIMVAESCSELAKMVGVSSNTIRSDVSHFMHRDLKKGWKFCRYVCVDDIEEEEE